MWGHWELVSELIKHGDMAPNIFFTHDTVVLQLSMQYVCAKARPRFIWSYDLCHLATKSDYVNFQSHHSYIYILSCNFTYRILILLIISYVNRPVSSLGLVDELWA